MSDEADRIRQKRLLDIREECAMISHHTQVYLGGPDWLKKKLLHFMEDHVDNIFGTIRKLRLEIEDDTVSAADKIEIADEILSNPSLFAIKADYERIKKTGIVRNDPGSNFKQPDSDQGNA